MKQGEEFHNLDEEETGIPSKKEETGI